MCLIEFIDLDPDQKKKRLILERLMRMLDQLREEGALKEREFYGVNAQADALK
jgi:hypothetical protein